MNINLDMARSYYVATANPFAAAPKLLGAASADVCVIGGGITGLSAALHAAERGFSVVLVEGGRIGWGASGRNGGQIIPGLRKNVVELSALYGRQSAKRLFDLTLEARKLAIALIEKHQIACDLKLTGYLYAAAKSATLAELAAETAWLQREIAYPHAEMLDADATRAELGSPLYQGAMLDRLGGHLHPLNYTLGLADAARAAGVRLFEHSLAQHVEQTGGVQVATPEGSVKARYAVLACDALLGALSAPLASRMMPVLAYQVATERLGDAEAAQIIAHDRAVSDDRFRVNYFRLSADKRLIFGGGERYSPEPPRDMAAVVTPHLQHVFPQLAHKRIDHAWGGAVSITTTRLPDIGRMGNVFYAQGYSGHGVLLSGFAGKLLAEAMAGTAERFDVFAQLQPPPFPGGAKLRWPLHVLGMLWLGLRDRLG